MAAFEGRKGECSVPMQPPTASDWPSASSTPPPTFDGLIAAGGCFLLSTVDGKVVCLTGRQ